MASLMETLIDILNKESSEYETLLELSMKKTSVIVAGDLDNLQKITDEEQIVVSRINNLEKSRIENINDIANVLNKDVKALKLANLIDMLEARPIERQKLAEVHDRLQSAVRRMQMVNNQNRELINHALEMVEFDMNLIQSMKTAPETAEYNKGAYNTGNSIGMSRGGFDAKQ